VLLYGVISQRIQKTHVTFIKAADVSPVPKLTQLLTSFRNTYIGGVKNTFPMKYSGAFSIQGAVLHPSHALFI
jgi:hypothetical protein